MNEQISTIQTREVLELMRNLAPILNQKELFEFMLFSNRVLKRYMPEYYNDGLSEEVTEMRKDKAWLKEEVYKLIEDYTSFGGHEHTFITGANVNKLGVLIDQLDEPETLSEEWIENHTASADTISYYSDENVPVVPVEKLKNLLVPTLSEMETDEHTQLERAYKYILNRGEFWFDDKKYVVVEEKSETVASVMADFFGAAIRLKEALGMEVEAKDSE